jgi:hypothetical protein
MPYPPGHHLDGTTRNIADDRLVSQRSTRAENLQRKKRPALLKEMLSA